MEFSHISVLLEETIDAWLTDPDGVYVDGTLGGGGHSSALLSRLSPRGSLIGIDQDADALVAAEARLASYGGQFRLMRGNFCEMKDCLAQLCLEKVDGILLDLGVSSYQLDNPARGFTYRCEDAPLDMRMDQRGAKTAADLLAECSESELFYIIRDYGEDRFAKNIAKHIVAAREKTPITTTGQLNDIIRAAIPAKVRFTGGHPSKRTFQALRIALNRELEVLQDSLDGMIDALKPGGHLCVITFHSIEDRIVKTAFKRAENPCTCPANFPVCVCGKVSKGKVLTRKPILPSEEELSVNSRSKSAKLRVFEKAAE